MKKRTSCLTKKTCRTLLSVLIAIAMLISMAPSMAFASVASPASQIGFTLTVNKTDGQLTGDSVTGSTENIYENGYVVVNKTVQAGTDENQFTITLDVTTKEKIEEISASEDAAVVLVIDTSGSMSDSTGGWFGTSRLYAAKKAAQTFINSFASATATRKVAIVEFGSDVKNSDSIQWSDASDLKTDSNYEFCDILDKMEADGGTNMDAALRAAKNQLDILKQDGSINNLNVVFLTDGVPTFYLDKDGDVAGDGNYTTHNTHTAAETAAKALTDAGYSTYAVYIGNEKITCTTEDVTQWNDSCDKNLNQGYSRRSPKGTPVATWLSRDCGFMTFSASNTDDLIKSFEDIVKLIQLKAQAWIVTDPMGDMIDYKGNVQCQKLATLAGEPYSYSAESNTLIWNLRETEPTVTENQDEKLYYYTLTYSIQLNTLADGFQAGTFVPTNGITSLSYLMTDSTTATPTLKYAYFNIPTVQGYAGSLSFTKTDSNTDDPLSGASFTLTTTDDPDWSMVADADANGVVSFTGIPSGHTYVMAETTVPDGYTAADNASVTVSYGEVAATQGNTNIVNGRLGNLPYTFNLSVEKEWVDQENNDNIRPDSITIGLYKNAVEDPIATVVLSERNEWKDEFRSLPLYENGQKINYTVQEVDVPDGYIAKVDPKLDANQGLKGYIITNTHEIDTVSKTVTKVWADDNDRDQLRPTTVKVQLLANGQPVGDPVELTAASQWTYTWADLPANENGSAITYTVQEVEVPDDYTVSYDQTTLTITNTHTVTPPVPSEDPPATGGSNHTVLWSLLMLSAAMVLVGSVVLKKKRLV